MRLPRGLGQRGASIVELGAAMVIGGFALAAITRFLASSQMGIINVENTDNLMRMNQRMSANLRQTLQGTKAVLADYAGNTYSGFHRSALLAGIAASPSGAPAPVGFSLAPNKVITGADSGINTGMASAMGNELSLLVALQPLTFSALQCLTCTPALTTTAYSFSVDRFQFVHLYLAAQAGKSVPGAGAVMRVVEWRSQPYVSLSSLDAFSGQRLTEACKALSALGYSMAMDEEPENLISPDSCFWSISPTGALALATAPAAYPERSWAYLDEFKIAQDRTPAPSARGRVSTFGFLSGISGYRSTYSVAWNSLSPTVNAAFKVNQLLGPGGAVSLPRYATPDKGGVNGFPGGFEIGILGRPEAREIYIGRTLMAISAGLKNRGSEAFLAHETVDYAAVHDAL